jgi:hypothetical protein
VATRYFSLDEACALIPRIRGQLGIALQLHASLRLIVEKINDAGYDVDWATLHGEVDLDDEAHAGDIRNLEKARGIYLLLRKVVDEIEDLGPEVKGVVDGLVDFPTWKDGEREVVLCWKMGEDTISHYHGTREGFAGRRPLGEHRFLADKDPTASADVATPEHLADLHAEEDASMRLSNARK